VTVSGSGKIQVVEMPCASLPHDHVMTMGSRSEGRKKITSDSQPVHSVSRRDLLAGTAATIACAFVPVSSLGLARTPAPKEALTFPERQSLEAVVSRIIPAGTDGPGALEAGCARYIESALQDAYQSLRTAYSAGLAALDAQARSNGGKSFVALGATEQDKILADFEQNIKVGDYSASAAFFELVRRHTLEGMFGDPSYGGNTNFAGWDLIEYPGPRMYVSPQMQTMDAKPPRSRVSAKQLVHGSR
jgi:gluconate 2-dehydrogenase gamma chain